MVKLRLFSPKVVYGQTSLRTENGTTGSRCTSASSVAGNFYFRTRFLFCSVFSLCWNRCAPASRLLLVVRLSHQDVERAVFCGRQLKLHRQRHLGIKDFACTECPMRFFVKEQLDRHTRNVHFDNCHGNSSLTLLNVATASDTFTLVSK